MINYCNINKFKYLPFMFAKFLSYKAEEIFINLLDRIEKKMEGEKLDVIIFGATGYTGKYVVQEFVKIANRKYTWGIAGRNKEKLLELLGVISAKTGEDLNKIPVVIADCSNSESLNEMARKAKVIINCCGPYRFYGEPVVKACVHSGAHHVDVSGEPEYMERIQLKYHNEAEEKGIYLISACGFDSVPADLGVLHFTRNFPGVVNSIESYMRFTSKAQNYDAFCNFATWESVVYALQSQGEMRVQRKQLFSNLNAPKIEPKLKSKLMVHKADLFDNKYCIPFFGSDRSVVMRTQIQLHNLDNQRPVQYNPYLVCESIFTLIALGIIGIFLKVLTKFAQGRKLLLKYPEIFSLGTTSRKGPADESLAATKAYIKFRGTGWTYESIKDIDDKDSVQIPPNKSMVTQVSFTSPGYGFTATSVVFCALTILQEKDNMPSTGGVYTPGGAFYKTSLLDKLTESALDFKVLSTESI